MEFARNRENTMNKLSGSIAAAAVLFFCAGAYAADNVLLALNTRATPEIKIQTSGLTAPATAQAKLGAIETGDFDALSVNDPLYREGSREFLEQVSRQDAVKPVVKPAAKPALRDAPISKKVPALVPGARVKESPAVKKIRVKKPVRSDPLNIKNTL